METIKTSETNGIKFDHSICQTLLNTSVNTAMEALLSQQNLDGHWRYDLEGHVFVPSFHVMTLYYIGEELDSDFKMKIGNYLRRSQLSSGGWGIVPNVDADLNTSVVAYFALRLIGDQSHEDHMRLASSAILKNGGIEETNFNVRNYLALFGIIPWRCVPSVPVEVMLLPSWFPITLYKIGFWGRTTIVPIALVQAVKKPANCRLKIKLEELFCGNPAEVGFIKPAIDQSKSVFYMFEAADRFVKFMSHFIPTGIHEKAMKAALSFCLERLNGVDGLGSIAPPMLYLLMALDGLGYSSENPHRVMCREALRKLEIIRVDEATVAPCLSPVWDTANAVDALIEVGGIKAVSAAEKGLAWLRQLQIRDVQGDWAYRRPNTQPGGWAFFYRNPHYPDTDDTAYVLSGMHRMSRRNGFSTDQDAIAAGTNWLLGMQSENGGWASYDADNTYTYLNSIPFAYEDSLVDPPTVDVTCSVMLFLAQTGLKITNSEHILHGVEFVLSCQEENGSWWGRWGIPYIYGTKYAVLALIKAGLPKDHPSVQKGVAWLLSIQNEDGGWGESVDSYKHRMYTKAPSTASQTSWVLLALMTAMELNNSAIVLGVQYLMRSQNSEGQWDEKEYTGTGHPRVMYLLYHGYKKYLPLLVLARYSKLKSKLINGQKHCLENVLVNVYRH